MTRTYIKDGKHKSYKNLTKYKELKTKLDFTPISDLNMINWHGKTKRQVLTEGYKEFLDKHNLTINEYGKITKA